MITDELLIVISAASACITFGLGRYLHQLVKSPSIAVVGSSSLLGFVVAILFYWNVLDLDPVLLRQIPVVVFGASFVGMSSSDVLKNLTWVFIAGLCFGLIFVNTSMFFSGFGGGLGTTACISVVITLGLSHLIQKLVGISEVLRSWQNIEIGMKTIEAVSIANDGMFELKDRDEDLPASLFESEANP